MNDSRKHECRARSGRRYYALVWLSLLLLAACGSSQRAPVADAAGGPRYLDSGRVHRVNAGETLYVIAWMYDLDPVALARVNNLREPYALNTGQYLSVDLRGTGSTAPRSEQTTGAVATPAATTASGVTVVPLQEGGAISRAPLGGGLQRTPLPSSSTPATNPPAAVVLPEPAPVIATAPPAAAVAPVMPTPVIATAPQRDEPAASAPVALPDPAPVPAVAVAGPEPVVEPPPVAAPVAADAAIRWAWPGDGRIMARFEESSVDKRGIDLAGNKGDPVRAAADGQVVYAGSGLLRYGDLIILKHDDRFLSAYAHNDRILVKEGDFVKQGDRIADLGSSGIDRNMLHFEIRVEGTPVDPLLHLPSR